MTVKCACLRQVLPGPGISLALVDPSEVVLAREVHVDLGPCTRETVDGKVPLERLGGAQAASGSSPGGETPDDVQEAVQGLAEALAGATQPLVDLIGQARAAQNDADAVLTEAIRHLNVLLNTSALRNPTWAQDTAAAAAARVFLHNLGALED